MNTKTFAGFTAALVLTAIGCGESYSAGDSCKQDGRTAGCETSSSILICQDKKIVSIPCRGPIGCKKITDGATCDVQGAKENDACSKHLQTQEQCNAAD